MDALRVNLTESDRKNIEERLAQIHVVGERYAPEMMSLVATGLRMSCSVRHVYPDFSRSHGLTRENIPCCAYPAAEQPREKYSRQPSVVVSSRRFSRVLNEIIKLLQNSALCPRRARRDVHGRLIGAGSNAQQELRNNPPALFQNRRPCYHSNFDWKKCATVPETVATRKPRQTNGGTITGQVLLNVQPRCLANGTILCHLFGFNHLRWMEHQIYTYIKDTGRGR